jgi:glucose/arabinose dehydrogenase
MAQPGDGSARLFIVQQGGEILILDTENDELLPFPFLDLSALVSCCDERGLLGLAFHPDYENNGWFYVDYTDVNGDSVVARYRVATDSNLADPTSGQILLTQRQPFANHNGGQIAFGPDGYLYIGLGDGGSGGDPDNNGQRRTTLLGKLLRIDVDSESPYAIPEDNPYAGAAFTRREIWAFGLRNPWRFSFDALTGDLFIADVGQNEWEEVNFQPAEGTGGRNYGWRVTEGNHCFRPSGNCDTEGLTPPILEYSHDEGCSVTGGFRYRGEAIPDLYSTYVFGDYCSGTIWGATPDEEGLWHRQVLLETDLFISTFGEDEARELYVADLRGSIYRFTLAEEVLEP